MNIAGIVKTSFIDYPGKASTVVFLGGCNFQCGYCHNRDIVTAKEDATSLGEEDFFAFLKKRSRFLDSVCISGGEPTLHDDLSLFARKIKELGYGIKLDTNGSKPKVLKEMIDGGLVDYVAMDIKGPWGKYRSIAGETVNIDDVKQSMSLLAAAFESGRILGEYRTTICKEQLGWEDLMEIRGFLPRGIPWYLQKFRDSGKLLDEAGRYTAYSDEEMKEMGNKVCASVR
jgi:pyruvate formate lyase activating enzyme